MTAISQSPKIILMINSCSTESMNGWINENSFFPFGFGKRILCGFFKKNKLKIIIEIKQNKTKKCEITKKEKEKRK